MPAPTIPLHELQERVTILTLRASETVDASGCDRCGSARSSASCHVFAMGKSEGPPRLAHRQPEQPRRERPSSVARWIEAMSREMGDEVGGGSDIDEMAEECHRCRRQRHGTEDPSGE